MNKGSDPALNKRSDPSPPPGRVDEEGRREGSDPVRVLLPVLLALAVSAACLWFLLTPQIVAAFARVLAEANPLPLLAAFALVALVQWLRAWRFAVMMTGRLALPGAALVRIPRRAGVLEGGLRFGSAARPRSPAIRPVLGGRGAGEGTRTPDPIITNDVLYQLSYTGARSP